jgi:hypothetical protein
MTDNIRKLYVEFHTQRRLKIEALTEQRRIQLIEEDGRENSPHATRDAYYWAMEQTSEEDELNAFAELIIRECADFASDYDGAHCVGTAISQHFGIA